MRKYLAGIFQQHAQQTSLSGREVRDLSIPADHPPGEIGNRAILEPEFSRGFLRGR